MRNIVIGEIIDQLINKVVDVVSQEIAASIRDANRLYLGLGKKGFFPSGFGWYSSKFIYIKSSWLHDKLMLKNKATYTLLVKELFDQGYVQKGYASAKSIIARSKNPYFGCNECVLIFRREMLADAIEEELNWMRWSNDSRRRKH